LNRQNDCSYFFKGGWPAGLASAPVRPIVSLIHARLERHPRHAAKLVRGLVVRQRGQILHDAAQRYTRALAPHFSQLFSGQLRLLYWKYTVYYHYHGMIFKLCVSTVMTTLSHIIMLKYNNVILH
jgi:hypothetical protein